MKHSGYSPTSEPAKSKIFYYLTLLFLIIYVRSILMLPFLYIGPQISLFPPAFRNQMSVTSINFRFSPCIIRVNHFYCLTNALNYTKLRG